MPSCSAGSGAAFLALSHLYDFAAFRAREVIMTWHEKHPVDHLGVCNSHGDSSANKLSDDTDLVSAE